MLEHFWWGAVFLLAVPVLAVFLVLGPILLPRHRSSAAGRLDLISVLLSLAAVLPVSYGLKHLGEAGLDSWSAVSMVGGLVVAVVFMHRQHTLAQPLLDLRLIGIRQLSASLGTLLLGIFVLWGMNLHLAQHLHLVIGLSPLKAGLWTTPSAGGVIVASLLAPCLARSWRPEFVVGAGLLLAALGFGLLTQIQPTSGPGLLVTGAVVASLGLGPMMTLSTDLVIGAAPADRVGAASALSTTAPQFGGALGVAILGTIGTAVYRAELTVPADLPPESAHTARQTLGNAVAAANNLDNPAAGALVASAREAFTQALHITAGISATALVATAVLTTTLLRRQT